MLVEDVVRHAAFVNLIVFQQLGGSSGVLTENQVHGVQHIERPEGDVLQVADRGWDDKEFHYTVLIKMQKYTILREWWDSFFADAPHSSCFSKKLF